MKNKYSGILVITLAVMLSLAFLMPHGASAEFKKMKFRAASIYPSPDVLNSMGKAMDIWQKEVTKMTDGAVTFENFYGQALGPGPEHIELVKTGAVDIAQTFPWYTPGRFPIHSLHYVFPFGPTDPVLLVKANRRMKKSFPQFRRDEAKQNVIMVSDAPGGPYDMMSKKPLRTIEDFKGQKVSLIGRYFGLWLPPGATPVVRPMADRYELVSNGVTTIDLHPFTHFYFTKMHELLKYYAHAKLMAGFHACVFVNLDVWKSLSPELQEVFLQAGIVAEDQMVWEVLPYWWEECVKEFKAAGVQFSEFPQEEFVKWAATLKDVPAEWAAEISKKGYPGNEIVDRWQEITTSEGYNWARKWGK